MKETRSGCSRMVFALAAVLAFADLTHAQIGAATRGTPSGAAIHRIEGRIRQRNKSVDNIRVRLVRFPQMQPVADTFTRQDGEFLFQRVTSGDYIIETFETDMYEATETSVAVYPANPAEPRPTSVAVFVDLPLKSAPDRVPPGEIMADVDLNVPKQALKHYQAGMQRLGNNESDKGIAELRKAIEIFSSYYAARLELGRELRFKKRFAEALEIVEPLPQIAPKRADPRIERGIVLLSLKRREEAISDLEAALRLAEASWAAHLYLGWALLEQDEAKAEPHFQRAIEIDERKAARAHLALARLAEAKGRRSVALSHLDAYLTIAPDAEDAEATRKLAERLRAPN
ncbi:MAG TPA: tetratricopeptide repeat protein [Pyrinomonadaceae bacterium]